MTTHEPPRTREQRKQDVLTRLEKDEDAWVATASASGEPHLMPLSFVWEHGSLLMCTRRTNPTLRNLESGDRPVQVTLGHTRDVVHITGTATVVPADELPGASADAFAAKLVWDPRDSGPSYTYFRVVPRRIQAWRAVNEIPDRDLMSEGTWLV
ncbi:pyridoxamine 5'-phosphate oxidase family protein [Streptomyces xanthochromogenes]|uniref:pyridoxamine 5'-phosphate oxidase family protein n=1 Tax=Streptomyces xanthochromogenes TaxID=67384 RepID=UPI00341A7151